MSACLFELCRGQMSDTRNLIKRAWSLFFLDHLFLLHLRKINNDIKEKSIYFEKGPVIILNKYFCMLLRSDVVLYIKKSILEHCLGLCLIKLFRLFFQGTL